MERSLERVVETRIEMLEREKGRSEAEVQEDCAFCRSLDCDIIFALLFTIVIICLLVLIMVFWLKGVLQYEDSKQKGHFSFPIFPKAPTGVEPTTELNLNEPATNIQCIYTFVAGQKQRVKLEFDSFELAGTADNCELEYVDIYSELQNPSDDLLSAQLGGRYCGTVAPHVRISLHNVIVLIFHSRVGKRRANLSLRGRYHFISDARYNAGTLIGGDRCGFLIEPKKKRKGQILSPTYPGTYPSNFHCTYLLKGNPGDRIRIYFRDFDIYFGGEHCPYDSMTIYDGPTNRSPIIRKVCGLQQRMEMFSFGSNMLIEFNTTNPAKSDPRGFVVEFEFSDQFVKVLDLLDGQKGVSHLRGSECDVRVESNRETTHYIQSPAYPNMYKTNTTCTYILDGLQGDQNLEMVILTFETFAVLSDPPSGVVLTSSDYDELECTQAFVGIATTEASMKAVMANNEESTYDATLCERFQPKAEQLGPYSSRGPRMVVIFGSGDPIVDDGQKPHGFRAKVEFKTDFGIPGEAVGDSNKCQFRFRTERGFFNSPRYPANYPLDTNCTYFIQARPGKQIVLYFEQFALHGDEKGKYDCNDWLEIFDVFTQKDGTETLKLHAKHCAGTFPGPTVSTFGSHEMRVVFSSDSSGTANGFKAFYEVRNAFKEDIPSKEGLEPRHCGHRIVAHSDFVTGSVVSPGYPIKYNKDVICDWEVVSRPGHQILLRMVGMDIEGEMTSSHVSCQNAVVRVDKDLQNADRTDVLELCGTDASRVRPIISTNSSVRISFFTSPDKVNGLKGFNFTWTEVRIVEHESECSGEDLYLCTYTKLCISARLRCNGEINCGEHDDTDEAHCSNHDLPSARKSSPPELTLLTTVVVSLFCYFVVY
ncbi:hypothetical protein QR680_008799 [Steinernema hermaphroditum]|uniref:CUB domain-containing protein n=1 Tax=Steinernema hermaphroditum TaxID=289476 RepID=A0AA39M8R2_9BILA|nr:hypothetical protein QR680_008799 [Steinernema hermaphroditum]